MKKLIVLFSALIFFLSEVSIFAQSIAKTTFKLGNVVVTAKKEEKGTLENKSEIESKTLKTHKIVDLAEILSDEMVEVTMIRKSAYGNEVALRGFGKSNLRFFEDGTIVEGACGSRKDPSFSHIGLLNVGRIEVTEGPFDVTRTGALGGSINVITKKPQKGFHGETLEKMGSYDYWSTGGYFTGGNKQIQGLLGYNYSESGQYEDGAGNKLSSFNSYNAEGKNMKAFKKHDVWGKVQFKPADNQTFLLSHTYGNAENIMTPRAGMDIESEKTNLSQAKYTIMDLGDISDKLTLSFYHNKIEHKPYDKYRDSSITDGYVKAVDVETTTIGGKIENQKSADFADFTYGFDMYHRNWDGYMFDKNTGVVLKPDFFPDADALNLGLYLKVDKDIDKWSLSTGIRGDYYQTKANDLVNGKLSYSQNLTSTNKKRDAFPGGYFSAKYHLNRRLTFFGGIGHSNRNPTLVERYLQASNGFYGNPDLKETKNTELDLGFQNKTEKTNLKVKTFYSSLDDYIYQQAYPQTWTNINARVYGVVINSMVSIRPNFFLEGDLSYQRGRKDSQPENNSNKNLAEIPPLKTKLAFNYDNSKLFGALEWIHSEGARDVDIDAGEKRLKGWDVFNLRTGYKYKQLIFNMGIDNIFDRKYAVANSYEWDVVNGASSNPKIVNEPGRFFYISISYSF